jgi:hypothetical protein
MGGPIALDLQSSGTTVSIAGKGTVWLWPGDLVLPRVAQLIANGDLLPWDDGEEAPESPEVYKDSRRGPIWKRTGHYDLRQP